MVFLPHTKTVILLEPYCGTITEPARIKGFSVPYRALSRVNMKKHCARASRFCFFLSDWKCINCNSICTVFLRTSMRWRFSLLIGPGACWAWLRCEAPSLLSYPGFLRNIGATHVTASVAHWFDSRIFFTDSSMYQIHPICKIAIFQFPHSLGAKDMPDSLVSKRWKYRIIKSNLLGLQSKLAESGGLSVLENNQIYRWRANWTLQCSKRFVTKTFLL